MSNLPQDRHVPIALCLWGTGGGITAPPTAMYSRPPRCGSRRALVKSSRPRRRQFEDWKLCDGKHTTPYGLRIRDTCTHFGQRTMAVGRITITL